jgi:hypothetical protein
MIFPWLWFFTWFPRIERLVDYKVEHCLSRSTWRWISWSTIFLASWAWGEQEWELATTFTFMISVKCVWEKRKKADSVLPLRDITAIEGRLKKRKWITYKCSGSLQKLPLTMKMMWEVKGRQWLTIVKKVRIILSRPPRTHSHHHDQERRSRLASWIVMIVWGENVLKGWDVFHKMIYRSNVATDGKWGARQLSVMNQSLYIFIDLQNEMIKHDTLLAFDQERTWRPVCP